MTKIGLVGLGFMGATHIKAYREVPGAVITALCSPSGRNLDGDFSKVTGNLGTDTPLQLDMKGVQPFRSFDEMLRHPGITAIDICSPTPSHIDLALRAMTAGKHVLCEKPLARSGREARRIAEAVAQAKVIFMPAMCIRFWPEWAWLRERIRDAKWGRVLAATFRRVAEPPHWGGANFFDGDKSGGALFDLHVHDTDFVQYCFGRPREVYSRGYSKVSSAIDHVITQYRFDDGPVVSAEGSWAMSPGFGFNMSYTVNFEGATADYDLSRGDQRLRLCEPGKPPAILQLSGVDGYVGELRHFVESVEMGRNPTVVTAADAISAVEICEAEEKSVRGARAIAL